MKPTPLGSHMLIQTPGSVMRSKIGCKGVEIIINGVDFLADLIVLDSPSLGIILGMNWLTKNQGYLDCAKRIVTITNSQGVEVKYDPNLTSAQAPRLIVPRELSWIKCLWYVNIQMSFLMSCLECLLTATLSSSLS